MSPRFGFWTDARNAPSARNTGTCGFNHTYKGVVPRRRHQVSSMTVMCDDLDKLLRDFLSRSYAEVSESLAYAKLLLDGSEKVAAENLARVEDRDTL